MKQKFKKLLLLLVKDPNNMDQRQKEYFIRENVKNIIDSKSFLNRNFHLHQFSETTLYVNIKYSNLFVFAYNDSGKLLAWSSGGSLNLKGKQQGSRYAGKIVTDLILLKLKELKIQYLRIIVKGKGPARRAAIQNIRKKKSFFITHIINRTQVSYNGCKLKKSKR
jgi:ribosomal protein S11